LHEEKNMNAYDLQFRFASKELAAHGDALATRTLDAGSAKKTLVLTAGNANDDYYNGGFGWFAADTTTVALRGAKFYVTDYVGSTLTLTLAANLPATPQAGDTLKIAVGAGKMSSDEIPGMTVDAGPDDVTGVVIAYASYGNTVSSSGGTLAYDHETTSLTWQDEDDDNPGEAVDVSTNGTYYLESEDTSKFLRVTVTAASLPAADASDTIMLSLTENSFLPDISGDESEDGANRYFAFFVYNAGAATAQEMSVYLTAPEGAATTMIDTLATTAASAELTSMTGWAATEGWVKNTTANAGAGDARSYKYRSGNAAIFRAAGTGDQLRGYSATSWSASDAVIEYPAYDIAVDAGSTDVFEDTLTDLTFSAPVAADDGLYQDDLAAAGKLQVAVYEPVFAASRSVDEVIRSIRVKCY
jgi:hypothetical protein